MRQNAISSVMIGIALTFCTSATALTPQAQQGPTFPFKVRKANRLTTASLRRSNTFRQFKIAQKNSAADAATTLFGDVVYADNWTSESSPYGIYSFPAASGFAMQSIYEDYNFKCNAGAVYADGLYNILNASLNSDNTLQSVNYYQYDAETWDENDENEFSDARFIATDMTVDPLTGTVYGAFNDGEGGLQLATFNFTSTGYSVKGQLSKHLLAIAADADGAIYGIGSDAILYKVDKETAQLTKVGSTGIKPASYLQSATFDWLSGKLYWATTLQNDMAGLYEVDTTTGKAQLVSYFPNNEEVVGLYCTNRLSAAEAPAAVSDLKAEFGGTSTTGSVSFTMPTATNDGEELSGPLTYTIKVNNETVKEGKANAGEAVTAADITVNGGNTEILVYASNDAGKGMPSKITVWTGNDAPEAPTEVSVSYADSKAHVSWTAPAASAHGGYLDKDNITYTVTRYPDNVKVADGISATEYTDAFKPDQLAAYYYTVSATANGMKGEEAKSNVFVAGDAVVPPYYQPFDDETTFSLMTVIDGNEDGTTWKMSAEDGCAKIEYADEGADDWLMTPQIKLTNDRMWKFSCRFNTPWAPNWPEKIGVKFGKAATADDMNGTILNDTVFKETAPHIIERYFTVSENGNYNIGIHAGSYELYRIQADSIRVEAGPLFAAPAEVSGLSATADATGKLSATVSFTTPTKTVGGSSLAKISKIEIYRKETLIHTFSAPATGEELSFTDINAAEGFNTYKVVGYNEAGAGYDVSTTVFVGEDIPATPTDVRITAENGKGTLTWTAPTTGVNGGFIDTKNLVYGIKDNANNTLATAASGTSFKTAVPETGEQGYLMYAVFAGNRKGYSESGISNAVIKGAPYTLPFEEKFDNDGKATHFWGADIPEGSFSSWGINEGSASYSGGQTGDEARLFSGKIDMNGAENPVLEFYYWYRNESGNEPLKVDIISEGKDTTTVKELEYTLYMNAKDFELVRVPLKQFKDKKFIQVSFYIKEGDRYTARAAVKDVSVRDYFDNDLAASVSAPSTAKAGEEIEITAKVKNIGKNTASDYTVNLYEGENIIATQNGNATDADCTQTYTFRQTVGTLKEKLNYKVVVEMAGDGNTENNVSDVATVDVTLPEYPAPEALSAVENGDDIDLAWTPADYQNFTITTTDGAEDYEEFADGTIGEWTTVDKDGLDTRSDITVDSYPVEFPQQGKKMSFIVMNPETAKAQFFNWMDEPTGWQPASGKQYFASFGSENGANDDWLISPELTGEAQTVSFKIHGYYGDAYEVLYSATGKSTDSFISLGSETAPINTWTPVSFDLPEGAKYFAIRNVSSDYPYYIFVDDILFKAAKDKGTLSLRGYNVYRDGKKLNAEPVATTSFSDERPVAGKHLYQVTAVYSIGESSATEYELDVTAGITATDAAGTRVVSAYSTSGVRIANNAKGIRIERMSDGKVRKVMAK